MSDFVSDTDRDILDALTEHRVATAAHLSALLQIPERTIRYRLTQLRGKGYTRAVRPPADKGSAPDHWCPTRKADSWAKGEHRPHGGDHRAPSTTFVEHSAAITALYVALKSAAGLGLRLTEWTREGAGAEEFEWRGRRRKIVPDALIVVADREAEYRAFVEIDLGSMSMTRLSQKLSGYAAYYAAQAWRDSHPFAPVLLLLTTSESRAEAAIRRFEQRWSQAQHHLGHSSYWAEEIALPDIGAGSSARFPEEGLREPVWLTVAGNDGLHLTDLLRPAWERWSQQQAQRREQQQAQEQWQRSLAADPELCRQEIQRRGSRDFESLAESFDDNECLALKLVLERREPMDQTEQAAFAFFSRRLAWSRREALTALRNPEPPSAEEQRLAKNLAAHYLDRQKRYVARRYAKCPESSAVCNAIDHLDRGGLLRGDEISRLPGLIAAHDNGASDRQARTRAYLSWREHAVETQRGNLRALPRLLFDRDRAAHELDLERLFFCRGCRQVVVPRDPELASMSPPECSLCNLRAQTSLAEAAGEGLVRPGEDGSWAACHPPVPAWVTKEAARPLAQSAGPHEEW